MPAPFEEIESPRLTITRTSSRGHRTFMIDTDDLEEFIEDLAGTMHVVGSSVMVINPAYYPRFPNLIVDTIETEAFITDAPQATTLTSLTSAVTHFTKTVVRVTYTPIIPNEDLVAAGFPTVPDDTFLSVEGFTGGEILTLPGNTFQWDSDSTDLPDDAFAGAFIANQEFSTLWQRVPNPPWSSMRSLLNNVNDDTFIGVATGHVLYLGSEFQRAFQFRNRTLWTLRHKFKARSIPWNHAYRKSTSAFEAFERQDGSKFYPESSFDPLFQFG